MTVEKLNPRCFLDIEIDGQNAGRIIIELYADACPLTCENFRTLCTGEKGVGKTTSKPLHYKGVPFHRIVKNFIIQSGDFVSGNGTGGESIYGGTFKDENFDIKHNKPYLLSMANKGKDTNGSQFFITTQPAPHLDGKHTVFGQVISGQQVVLEIENQQTTNSRPLKDVVIANCGELVLKVKPKAKRAKSISESSASAADDERSRSRKKKRSSRKHEKRSKKERKEMHSSRSDMTSKYDESFDCSVKAEDIPEVPVNVFLMRRSPNRDDGGTSGRQGGFVFHRKPALSRSGRKIKGRGLMRYRTPSSSGGSRSGSETPPHWRQAQSRVIPLDKVINKISKVDRSRSATPEEGFEHVFREKKEGLPLRQRLGAFRKISIDKEEEEGNYQEHHVRNMMGDFRRGRDQRQRRESPRRRNDRINYNRRGHSANEEESDTSPEGRTQHHSFRSMVVKAESERHEQIDERDQRARRSPLVRRDRQRNSDQGPPQFEERPMRNQYVERDRENRRERFRGNDDRGAAKFRQETERGDRQRNREFNSRRSPKRNDRVKSSVPRRKPSVSSDSDTNRRRRRDSQRHSPRKTSTTLREGNAEESGRSRNSEAAKPKALGSQHKEVYTKGKQGKDIEKELGISSSLRRTLLAYVGEAFSSESEAEKEDHKKTSQQKSSINDVEAQVSCEKKNLLSEEVTGASSNGVLIERKTDPSEILSSVAVENRGLSSMPMEVDSARSPYRKVETNSADFAESDSCDVVEKVHGSASSYLQDARIKTDEANYQEADDEQQESINIGSAAHDRFEQNSSEPMDVDEPYLVSADHGDAAVPESSSSTNDGSENLVSSSVVDRLVSKGDREDSSKRSRDVDYSCIPFPLDVIPLPEEIPFISDGKDNEQSDLKRRSLLASKKERATGLPEKEFIQGRKKMRSPVSRSRSRSRSSSGDRKSSPGQEFSAGENSSEAVQDQKFATKERHEREKTNVAHRVNVTMIPSVLRHSTLVKSRSKKSSESDDLPQHAKKSPLSNIDEPVHLKTKSSEAGSPSTSHSSAECKLVPPASKSHSSDRKSSPSHQRKPSPSYRRKSPHGRSSGSPSDKRSRSPVGRRSRSPVRPRRSPAGRGRHSPSPPMPRRGYRKSRSPVRSKSPVRRRSRSSSRSPSPRRSRSRSRSPVRRRYSRSPERRYYRRSWSRPYDGRSRFSRYARPRNRSPDRPYRGYGRERASRRSRSRSRSRSEVDQRRKRRDNRSSSGSSTSRSSSSSSRDKKPSKRKDSKKKRSSSSASSSGSSTR